MRDPLCVSVCEVKGDTALNHAVPAVQTLLEHVDRIFKGICAETDNCPAELRTVLASLRKAVVARWPKVCGWCVSHTNCHTLTHDMRPTCD